jgi:hypothetical protein
LISNDEGECTLLIREAEPHDSGRYTCRIEEFGKAGENETSCDVTVGGQSKLETALNIVELIDTVTVADTLAGLFVASFVNVTRACAYVQSFL